MKKIMTAVTLLGLSLPVMAQAMEFQTPGALGMGRAGVARTTDSYATFINPAGLAFYEKSFSMRLGAGVGVAISSSLADNVDKIGKLDLSTTDMNYSAGATAQQVTDATAKAAQYAGVLQDLNDKKGDLAVNVDLTLGFQFRNFGLGIIGISEVGAGVGSVDLVNIRAGNTGVATSVTQLSADMGASSLNSNGIATYFSPAEYSKLLEALAPAATSTAAQIQQAKNLLTTLEVQLKSSGGNTTGLTPAQIAQGLQVIAPTLTATSAANTSIDNNKTTVLLRGLAVVEVPLAYGHKFDLGSFGKLGIGAAAKVMQGTVYSTDYEVMKLKDSKDITSKVKDNHSESTQLGVDLGVLWRLEEIKFIGPINVGLAVKNLNSPKFDGPKDPVTFAPTEKVKVEPQGRIGLGLEPLSWLSLAADFDITKNKTIMQGRDSQNIGGGLEAHFEHWYALWLALRAGAYKNIAETAGKPVITGGLSLGPRWMRFDLDAAVATATGRYDNQSYPREAKVEFGLSTTF